MSTYLIHSMYYRRIDARELAIALDAGHGLLIVNADGNPEYVGTPLKIGKAPEAQLRAKWMEACEEGRVHLVWGSRWSADDEMPPHPVYVQPETTECAESAETEVSAALTLAP